MDDFVQWGHAYAGFANPYEVVHDLLKRLTWQAQHLRLIPRGPLELRVSHRRAGVGFWAVRLTSLAQRFLDHLIQVRSLVRSNRLPPPESRLRLAAHLLSHPTSLLRLPRLRLVGL